MLPSEQDGHLDRLSHSINRQRDISLQINDELDVHTGLLQELDTDLDHTESRLSRARRGLDRVAQGTRENGSLLPLFSVARLLMLASFCFRLDRNDWCPHSLTPDPNHCFQDVTFGVAGISHTRFHEEHLLLIDCISFITPCISLSYYWSAKTCLMRSREY